MIDNITIYPDKLDLITRYPVDNRTLFTKLLDQYLKRIPVIEAVYSYELAINDSLVRNRIHINNLYKDATGTVYEVKRITTRGMIIQSQPTLDSLTAPLTLYMIKSR